MVRQIPSGQTDVHIEGLGSLKGVQYQDGSCQFFGIPYAHFEKRWTRSKLVTQWEGGQHDGTKLGFRYPTPTARDIANDPLVPVRETGEFGEWRISEDKCLNLNVATPCVVEAQPTKLFPVMVWIHGGAYWFGGNFHPGYDLAHLVSRSITIGQPVVVVSINYRLGIGGFLASSQIKDDLGRDGLSGVGNFGLTDQQTALEWVQQHISKFHGDPAQVTIFGESAGGISVAHQVAAAQPARFCRAIQMSGSLNLTANWSLERHQQRYDRLCKYFNIDPHSATSLHQLRQIPEFSLHEATLVLEPSDFTVYRPCNDGVFHSRPPTLTSYGPQLPEWLKGIMIGDTRDEGELWRHVVVKHRLPFFRSRMQKFMTAPQVDRVLQIYGLDSEVSTTEQVVETFIDLIGDMMFKMQNYFTAHQSKIPATFAYHVDQVSSTPGPVQGQAHHALDISYVFLSAQDTMSESQTALAKTMATDWITFAHGHDPWNRFAKKQEWMVYGDTQSRNGSSCSLLSEDEDNAVRRYDRWRALLENDLYEKVWAAVQDIAHERYRLEAEQTNGYSKSASTLSVDSREVPVE